MNTEYFKVIDTPEKAYWLGFITADGCLSTHKGVVKTLQINLKRDDKNHLNNFIQCINWDKSVIDYTVNGYSASRISIGYRDFIDNLMGCGLQPRKSMTCQPWEGPENLMPHYWRGVWDGDGSIYKGTRKRKDGSFYPIWRINLTGNFYMVSGFQDFIITHGAEAKGSIGPHGSVYRCSWGGNKSVKFVVSQIYKEPIISLERKHQVIQELLEE